jgi:hypothetical protein
MSDPIESALKGAAKGFLDHTDQVQKLEDERDKAYQDRNTLAVCLVAIAGDAHGPGSIGWYDHGGDGWAVIYADLPTGQVSWHVPKGMIPATFPERDPDVYDGHSREEKNQRLLRILRDEVNDD